MDKYGKYFLDAILWLEDDFCVYYLQDDFWGRKDILDAGTLVFNWEEEVEQWLHQCARFDHYNTLARLRSYLVNDCLRKFQVYRMNDRKVIRAAAGQICLESLQLVVEPKLGWTLELDGQTRAPAVPITVEPAPDMDGLLDELKIHLDAMVADRQRRTEQLNAKLAEMNALERSWELQKRTFKSAPQYLPIRNAVDALRAIPDTVKTMGRLLATGGSILEAVTDAVRAGSMEPINYEIEQAVAPMVGTAEQARRVTAMVQVLLNDEETCDLLYDFGERYVKAMHPLDIADYGLKAASVIVTLIASIAATIYTGGTGGAGTAGKLLINIKRLRDASPVVDKIYKALKCMAHRLKLPKLKEKVAIVKRKRTKNKGKNGVPEAKMPDKIDNKGKKGYSGDDDGPKTTGKKPETKPVEQKSPEPPKKEKVKTKGTPEEQLSTKARNEPVPLTNKELANVEKWSANRNKYLKKWREKDLSEYPEETQRLLNGSADRSIRKNMTPDDMAAVIKEQRGVEILKPDGTPYKHLTDEWPNARRSILNTIGREDRPGKLTGIKGRLNDLDARGLGGSKEASLLREKLGDLSNVLDEYESLLRAN